jgi:hypothetical protein
MKGNHSYSLLNCHLVNNNDKQRENNIPIILKSPGALLEICILLHVKKQKEINLGTPGFDEHQ